MRALVSKNMLIPLKSDKGQNDIYHIIGGSIAAVSSSPFLKALRKKGLEVLDMVEYAVHQLKEYDGKKLKSMTKEGLAIDDEDEKKKLEELKAEFEPLTKLMKDVLGDKTKKVAVSGRMADSPCMCLHHFGVWMVSNTLQIRSTLGLKYKTLQIRSTLGLKYKTLQIRPRIQNALICAQPHGRLELLSHVAYRRQIRSTLGL